MENQPIRKKSFPATKHRKVIYFAEQQENY